MYKYEMDPASIVEDTEQHHSIHRQMDRRTRWNQYTPPPNFIEVGVYVKIVSDIQAVYACKVRKCGQNILGHQYSVWVIAFKYVVLLNI